MCDELTAFQKLLLRWALENREGTEVAPVTQKVEDGEIVTYVGDCVVSRKQVQIQKNSAEDDSSCDLDEEEILSIAFGTIYKPTPAADFGLSSARGASVLSRQYYIAERLIVNPILELDAEHELVEFAFYGRPTWDGWPARLAFNLIPAGIEVARQLEGEVTRGKNGCWELDPKMKACYEEALASAGISPEDIVQAQKDYDASAEVDVASIKPILQMLGNKDPRTRMAAAQFVGHLGELGKEAIPSLEVMVREEPEPAIRRWAGHVLKRISEDR